MRAGLMRALVCNEFGPADSLRIEQWPAPAPGPGEVVVDIHAAALNFPDYLMISGQYQVRNELPFIPGSEAAGVVVAAGPGVTRFSPGDRVIALPTIGAFADRCKVPEDRAVALPDHLSFEAGAAFTIIYATAMHALKQGARLRPGETVLVLGAAGGVGSAAVELAHAMGARAIAAASTSRKLEFARQLGAADTINYTQEPLREAVNECTGGHGVDVVVDPVGGDLTLLALRSLARRGRYLVVGFASGSIPELPANLPLLKEASIIGVWWGSWHAHETGEALENMHDLMRMAGAGQIAPRITASYALEDYVEAFASLTGRQVMGKAVFNLKI